MNDSFLYLVPKINDSILAYRVIKGQAIVIDLTKGTLNILNKTATLIWQLIQGGATLEEISKNIVKEFQISFKKAFEDVIDILQAMAMKNWVKNFPYSKVFVDSSKENAGLFNELREEAMKGLIPLVVHFDLTYRCPLKCVHCYITDENNQDECSLEEVKDILDQIANTGTLYLTFSGGEIFLRKDIIEIISYARNLHFAIRLLTSGVLIDSNIADIISEWHPEMVAFSIYSLNPLIHDSITQRKGSLAKTLKAIYLLKERNVPIKISSVVMKNNITDYREVYKFAQELGAQFQADFRITPKIGGSKEPLKLQIEDKDILTLLSDPIFSQKDTKENSVSKFSTIFNKIPCGAGHMSCYISPYCIVTPCVQVPILCGNLRKTTFDKIWKNSPYLKAFRAIRFSSIPKCANCTLLDYCRPCVGLNLVETGDITTPPQRVCSEAEYMKILNRRRR